MLTASLDLISWNHDILFLPFNECIWQRSGDTEMEEKLKSVDPVKIDEGTFKYILIKVYDPDNEETSTYIVRGLCSAEYHGDIYEVTTPDLEKLGLECECVGGGRIKHNAQEKTIHVYGYSQGYGRADHLITCRLLKEHYPGYSKIDFSNDGY